MLPTIVFRASRQMRHDLGCAYDAESHVGRLDRALDEAKLATWTAMDMKQDWKRVFSFEKP